MQMKLPTIFSARNVTLVVFILVVLVLGTIFNTHVGPEGMEMNSKKKEGVVPMKTTASVVTGSSIGSSMEKAMSSALGNSPSATTST